MQKRKLRIAVGQISSESNHFVSFHCELDFFRNTGYLLEGDDLFKLRGAGNEVAGILNCLDAAGGVEIIPLLAARANSSGTLSEECYSYLKNHLLAQLAGAGAVDSVILSHHGSMTAVGEDDPEGDIASAVRQVIGPHTPLIMTLDCHGNITRRMVKSTNAILGYEHYPHDDVFTTGERGCRLLLKAARGEVRPVIGHAKVPMLLTGFNASTYWNSPFAQMMDQAKCLERCPGILSASIFMVGSYIDIPDLGCSSLVVTDGDVDRALEEAGILAERYWTLRHEFQVETLSVQEAVKRGREIPGGPILLLDTADTTGGGAAGDGIGLVKGLLETGVTETCLAMVVDPDAAQACARAGVGSTLCLRLGHGVDPRWGRPLEVAGRVTRISDGRFTYTGGILGGASATMGTSAVFEVNGIRLLVSTYPTYDWADEQYRSVGLAPEAAKFVGVKNMMNFRIAYRDIMKGFFVLNVPGPTPPDMRMLQFQRVNRPLFPLDSDFDEPGIILTDSESQQN